jgi:predicted Holliday junction resolvase-like endonuclease
MNVVAFFHESKQILGICPCCGEIFHLSEATLYTKEPPPRTAFDALESEQRNLEQAITKFEEKEDALREKAVAKGQRAAEKRVNAVAGPFVARKIKLQDVKVIFDPVEFVAFRGMTDGLVDRVALIDRPASSTSQEKLQASVAKAVKAGNYEWNVLRITADGQVEYE